jgi:uncharacterized protein HemY
VSKDTAQQEKELALQLARLVLARRALPADDDTVEELAEQALEAAELRADDYDDSTWND